MDLKKVQSSLNLENEIGKVKISIAFVELLNNMQYKEHIINMIKGLPSVLTLNINIHDSLNIQEDSPTFLFGPHAIQINKDVLPFYVVFNIHDMVLHNVMLNSGASHNLILNIVIDNLGLDITRTYKELSSFDSRKVQCLGLIQDLALRLT